jgi:hypothetical protein
MLNNFTVKQLLIAAGLARKLSRTEICRVTGCVTSYITKSLNRPDFTRLVDRFQKLPADKDTNEYKGLGTLLMEVGRLLYLEGEHNG